MPFRKKKKPQAAYEDLKDSLEDTRGKLAELAAALADSVDTDEVKGLVASWSEQAQDKLSTLTEAAGEAAEDVKDDPKKRKKLLLPVVALAGVAAVVLKKKSSSNTHP